MVDDNGLLRACATMGCIDLGSADILEICERMNTGMIDVVVLLGVTISMFENIGITCSRTTFGLTTNCQH